LKAKEFAFDNEKQINKIIDNLEIDLNDVPKLNKEGYMILHQRKMKCIVDGQRMIDIHCQISSIT